MLQEALQHNNSLCFLARIAPGVHGADELVSMGSPKVLLENNSASSHEKRRRESSLRVSLLLIDSAHPCEASGWAVQREWDAHEIAISCPGNRIIASFNTS